MGPHPMIDTTSKAAHIAAVCDGDAIAGANPTAALWRRIRGMYTVGDLVAMRDELDRAAEARMVADLGALDAGVAEQIANAWAAAQ